MAIPAGLSQALACLRGWAAALMLLLVFAGPAQANGPDAPQAQLQRTTEALYLSARLRLQPGPAVEDALIKGVPLYFVWNADVYRYRWYWRDKRVASVTRTLRLAYQPLTRRWRLSVASESSGHSSAGLQYALHQNFESLAQAMAAVGHVARWKIADAGRLDEDDAHRVEWALRLDLTLLPRPFQIGMSNQPEWIMEVQRVMRVPTQIETDRRTDPASEPGLDAPGDATGAVAEGDR